MARNEKFANLIGYGIHITTTYYSEPWRKRKARTKTPRSGTNPTSTIVRSACGARKPRCVVHAFKSELAYDVVVGW